MSEASPLLRLPELSLEPGFHRHCCTSLSIVKMQSILKVLPNGHCSILSIGSGSGLLEVLLTQENPRLHIEGVEVSDSINKYLPVDRMNIVRGTWDVCGRAAHVSSWLFVYPRSPDLVRKYLERFGQSPDLEVILWIGPRDDWLEYELVLKDFGFETTTLDLPNIEADIITSALRSAKS